MCVPVSLQAVSESNRLTPPPQKNQMTGKKKYISSYVVGGNHHLDACCVPPIHPRSLSLSLLLLLTSSCGVYAPGSLDLFIATLAAGLAPGQGVARLPSTRCPWSYWPSFWRYRYSGVPVSLSLLWRFPVLLFLDLIVFVSLAALPPLRARYPVCTPFSCVPAFLRSCYILVYSHGFIRL